MCIYIYIYIYICVYLFVFMIYLCIHIYIYIYIYICQLACGGAAARHRCPGAPGDHRELRGSPSKPELSCDIHTHAPARKVLRTNFYKLSYSVHLFYKVVKARDYEIVVAVAVFVGAATRGVAEGECRSRRQRRGAGGQR